ncbi:MAG: 4Fe-4S dicluster domain-containing protein [Desulfobacterales bacterium]|nr:4Fe-4S dicluster domain-containing protein [Desulfobacterales bacterium]
MGDKILKKAELQDVLRALKRTYEVFVPVKENDFYSFKPLMDEEKVDLSFTNTRLSPKPLVLPQSERMFEFTLDEKSEDAHIVKESPKDYPPRIIAGVRPCDAKALRLLQVNFDNPEFKDPWWVKRRESMTLIGLGCSQPCSACFCTSVGCGPFNEEGLDILLFDLGECLLARTLTEKGERLLQLGGMDTDADSGLKKSADEVKTKAEKKISSHVPTDKLREKNVNDLFDAPFWDDVAFACINCGTCTFLCPTCWCFDIQDEVIRGEGDRIRNWDSCMFPLFTLHASGHNPRAQKVQRIRQRFMHKLKYYVDKYSNGVACVGCGRCVKHCPVNIDIREVFNLMNEL